MNAPIIKQPEPRPLRETPYLISAGDQRVQLSQYRKALAMAVDRTRTRGCRQQVRQWGAAHRYWIIQDVR